jgi:hypothetical protein
MKAEKLAIQPWLICQYNENTLMDLPSSVISGHLHKTTPLTSIQDTGRGGGGHCVTKSILRGHFDKKKSFFSKPLKTTPRPTPIYPVMV